MEYEISKAKRRRTNNNDDEDEDDTTSEGDQSLNSNVVDLFGENNDAMDDIDVGQLAANSSIPLNAQPSDNKPKPYSSLATLATNYINESSSSVLQLFQALYVYMHHLVNLRSNGKSFVVKRNADSLIAPLLEFGTGHTRNERVLKSIRNLLVGKRQERPIITDASVSNQYNRLLYVSFNDVDLSRWRSNNNNGGGGESSIKIDERYGHKRLTFAPTIDLIKLMKIEHQSPSEMCSENRNAMFKGCEALADKRLVKPDLCQTSEFDEFVEYLTTSIGKMYKCVNAEQIGRFFNLVPRCIVYKIVIEEKIIDPETKEKSVVVVNECDFWNRVGSKKTVRSNITTKCVAMTNEEIETLNGEHALCYIQSVNLKVPTENAVNDALSNDETLYTTLSFRVSSCLIVSNALFDVLRSIDQDIVVSDDDDDDDDDGNDSDDQEGK
ncbi:Hypothetical predicted protein [Olea europaea subsp. europaea]|uniref:Uncharacterized protein n=1 Tax=Olea europaea subsp. europaea TaxID=158383 RepID=A0A8S0TKZ4_OLEEU|nr:Hypothetical predicted protein [Olea europaea subsp. europaea]